MRLKSVVTLLGLAAAAVHGLPALDERKATEPSPNSTVEVVTANGFEVVIVYATPAAGCPAKPKHCNAPGPAALNTLPAAETTTSSKPSPSASFEHSGPIATLKPQVHWDVDTGPATNVIPVVQGKGSDMYYGIADPSQAGHFAFLTYYFSKPSVNLDHCDHIRVVEYSTDGLTITFLTREAYDHARGTWVADDEIILVTYTAGCGDYATGERCYVRARVEDLIFKDGSLIIVAGGKPYRPDDLITKGETQWGWWTPRTGGVSAPSPPKDNAGSTGSGSGNTKTATTLSPPSASSSFSWGSTSTGSPTAGSGASPSETSASGFSAPKKACTPPADTKYRLPTACLGELFDQDLDEELGWEDMPALYTDFIESMAPGLDSKDAPNEADFWDRRRALSKRWPCLSCALKKYVIQPAVSAYKAVQAATSISGSINKDISFKVPDPASANAEAKTLKDPNAKQVVSPWGDAILLKALGTQAADDDKKLSGYMNVFCVGCGASGSAKIAGSASWTPIGGFTKGEVDVRADIQFVLKLGIDAQMNYKQKFGSDLLNVGLPGLSYGIVTIGPRITVGTSVELEAVAKGRLLVGAEMGLQNAHVLIDFVNPLNSKKDGWDPYFKPTFEAEGEIMLSAALGLPIGLRCGLQIGKWDKSIGVVDEPSIKGVAQVAASISKQDASGFVAGFKDTNGCTGISTQISWRNQLYIDVLGTKHPLLDTKDKPLAQGCIKLPGLPASSSSSTSADASSTATTASDAQTVTSSEDSSPTTAAVTTTASDQEESKPSPTAPPGEGEPASPPSAVSTSSSPETPDAASPDPAPTPTPDAEPPTPEAKLRARQAPTLSSSSSSSSTASSASTAASGKVVDITAKIKSPSLSNTLSYTTQPLPNKPYNDTNGFEYALLADPTATTLVVACANGNVYAVDAQNSDNQYCSEQWATGGDNLVSDASQRLLHYYANTMAAAGISRVRLEDEADLPTGGVVFALAPFTPQGKDENADYFYVAVDPMQNFFYLIVCDYEDPQLGSKLFLAKDIDRGIDVLRSKDVTFSVTGGDIKACYPIALQQGKFAEGDGYASAGDAKPSADWDLEDGWFDE
ncbi:hypothetical protein B0H63DRAFT_543033 [Podospora didyma]|uniref:DUF7029 domain-containing protein n=1 Tax=Podospora didyma TaxID=330526 RepID=A0AAE0NNS8_9PEZI|nr:hypothetical protein B0H63DRAFT_543033 [Podospora didyma]